MRSRRETPLPPSVTPVLKILAAFHAASYQERGATPDAPGGLSRSVAQWILPQLDRPVGDWRFRIALVHLHQASPVHDWPAEPPYDALIEKIGLHPHGGSAEFAWFWDRLTGTLTSELLNRALAQSLSGGHPELTVEFGRDEVRLWTQAVGTGQPMRLTATQAPALQRDIDLFARWGHPRLLPLVAPGCLEAQVRPDVVVATPDRVVFRFAPDPFWLTRFRVSLQSGGWVPL